MSSVNKFVLVWALALTTFILLGMTIPHTFAPGTTISSAEMNANFAAVKTAVDALEAQGTTHASRLADLRPESGLSPRQIQYARDHGLEAAYVEPTTGIRFVLIPPGEFWMGSPATEVSRQGDETHHHVRLTKAFYLAAHEVTNAQYRVYDAGHTSTANGDQQPVTEVSHTDVVAFVVWLSTQTGDPYDLPSEAQWEYACRAGTTTPFSFGENINPAQVNYHGGFPYNGAPVGLNRSTTTDVGSFPANAWGLYDMHGNVWEWCLDWYASYSGDLTSVTVDPKNAAGSGYRVSRGGSWLNVAAYARSAFRAGLDPGFRLSNLGVRPARPITP